MNYSSNNELRHYGVIGMKWGVRRYQNKDGTLTAAGRKRYGVNGEYRYTSLATKNRERKASKAEMKGASNAEYLRSRAKVSQEFDDNQLNYAKKTSTGKAVVGRLLGAMGQYRTYSMARSTGTNRGKAVVQSLIDLNIGITGLSVQQHLMREKYIDDKLGVSKSLKSGESKSSSQRLIERQQKREASRQAKQLKKDQKAWDQNTQKNWYKAYNKAGEEANRVLIPWINEKIKGLDEDSPEYQRYVDEYFEKFDELYQEKFKDMFGERPA